MITVTDERRRLIRTVFSVVVGAAAAMPLLVHTAGVPDTVPGLSVLLSVSAAVTRLMALPVVESWLPSWLRRRHSGDDDPYDPTGGDDGAV